MFTDLDQLVRDDFLDRVGYKLPPKPMRERLRRMPEYSEFRESLRMGTISEFKIRLFVQRLLDSLTKGEQFAHDIPLAFLAVGLEPEPNEFADRFIRELANVEVAELNYAAQIAKEVLHNRGERVGSSFENLNCAQPGEEMPKEVRFLTGEPSKEDAGYSEEKWSLDAT